MRRSRVLALLLALTMLAGLFGGCGKDPAATTAPPTEVPSTAPQTTATTEPPEPDWAALYSEAAAAFAAAPDRTVTYSITEERTVGGDTLTETTRRTARFQGMDAGAPVIHVADRISYGSFNAAIEQTWSDGTLYAKVKNAKYYGREELEEFLDTLLPAVLLHPENYGSVTGADGVLTFADPEAAEPWAMPADGDLREAAASAVLREGALTAVDYEITYGFGGSEIHTVYHAELQPAVEEDLSALVPENAKGYESLDSVAAALLLYRGRMALENARIFALDIYSNYYTSASAALLVRTEKDRAYVTEDRVLYGEDAQYVVMDLRDQSTTSQTYMSRYRDGVLTEGYDGEEETVETLSEYERTITEETYAYYMSEDKEDCFPNYGDLVDAKLYDLKDYWLVEFSLTDEFSEKLKENVNLNLYGDPYLLGNYATAYTTKKAEGFVAVEKYTWLPTCLSLSYEGVYTIDGMPASIQLFTNTAIQLYDPDTYEEIMDEPLPDTEPEAKPTPVFYEVTGDNGEKMYLFGTIHVGDARTAFLPQAIYDAFDSADALAVEFDTDAFTDSLEEDEALQETIRAAYVYSDGTTVKNHIDSELYEIAVKLMRTAGQYTQLAEQYRPFVWSQLIENFYLAQGRRLTSSKGVDNRLMARAREQEKEIRNVESGEFQIGMMAGYSDEVQEMLLGQAVASSRNEYLRGVYELYELWCRGDEAVLIERVAAMTEEERAEVDEDDLAVYDEYHQKMEVERNAHMLETAEGWLQSGDTVFFAVGLAHLLGDGGLVEALREAGYTVTLVQ